MFEHGIHRAGYLSVPARPDLAYDFLAVVWTSIQHYGVQINGLRYNGPVLIAYRNQASPYTGVHAGKWPVAVDPGDVRSVYFQDPADHAWHPLVWEHAADLNRPFSTEALSYARQLAATTQRYPDLTATLVELLDRWGAGLTESAAERRMAVRLSQQRLRLVGHDDPAAASAGAEEVSALPSVRRLTAISAVAAGPGSAASADGGPAATTARPRGEDDLGGDDDEDSECDADPDASAGSGQHDFYADVMDSG